MIAQARWVAVGVAVALVGALAGCTGGRQAAPTTPSSSTSSSLSSSSAPSSSAPSSSFGETPTSSTEPGSPLPGDITPNVVEDECLLTGDEFGALVGQTGLIADNTEIAGDAGRRSCFYAPPGGGSDSGDPVGRIDVYASASLPPADLVARIAANGAGGRPLTGVGAGAVILPTSAGATEFVVASATLLGVLTVLPGAASNPPPDEAWTAAGVAMAGRLPR